MTLTVEQQSIYDAVQDALTSKYATNVVIHVDAKAGTGKTALTKYIVENNPTKTFIYTAFNKKIVEDGVSKFGKANCKTFHALAYKFTVDPKIGNLYPNGIRSVGLTYTEKRYIVDMLDKYCLSRHLSLNDFATENGISAHEERIIMDYLDKMEEREIHHTFNYMLKELHHALAAGEIIIEVDMLFVDEAQDLTPVMLEIFGLIQANVKIYLGDTSQDIYSFLDLVSAFTLSKETYDLTKSFRLSPAIAARIEPFCQKNIDPSFKIEGVGTGTDTTEAFLTHSNAEIIEHIVSRQNIGLGYSFTRPVKEIFEVPLAVKDVLDGIKSKNSKYWGLEKILRTHRGTWKELAENEDLDDDISNAIKLLYNLKRSKTDIRAVLDEAETNPTDHGYLIGTAHSIKGSEFGTVTISRGLNRYVEIAIQHFYETLYNKELEDEKIEACKLYYVACSRAIHTLHNANVLKH